MAKKLKASKFEPQDDNLKTKLYIYISLTIMAFLAIYPLIDIFKISLRPGDQMFSTSLAIIPEGASLEHYYDAFFQRKTFLWLKNTLFIALLNTALTVFFASASGYAFSRFRFPGRVPGLIMLMATQMFPAAMILLPLNILLSNLHLNGKVWALTIPYLASTVPFATWLFKGFFDTIPIALEESAKVDGASIYRTFYQIILPLTIPAFVVAGLYAFLFAWTEFIVARIMLTSEPLYTLQLGLLSFNKSYGVEWGPYTAAALVTSLPVMIVFVSMSKHLVGGLTSGSVK